MRISFCKIVGIVLLLFSTLLLADETPVLTRTGKSFDPSIPTLQSVLGYDFGEQITRHRDMELYLSALAKASTQIKVETIGKHMKAEIFITSSFHLLKIWHDWKKCDRPT